MEEMYVYLALFAGLVVFLLAMLGVKLTDARFRVLVMRAVLKGDYGFLRFWDRKMSNIVCERIVNFSEDRVVYDDKTKDLVVIHEKHIYRKNFPTTVSVLQIRMDGGIPFADVRVNDLETFGHAVPANVDVMNKEFANLLSSWNDNERSKKLANVDPNAPKGPNWLWLVAGGIALLLLLAAAYCAYTGMVAAQNAEKLAQGVADRLNGASISTGNSGIVPRALPNGTTVGGTSGIVPGG